MQGYGNDLKNNHTVWVEVKKKDAWIGIEKTLMRYFPSIVSFPTSLMPFINFQAKTLVHPSFRWWNGARNAKKFKVAGAEGCESDIPSYRAAELLWLAVWMCKDFWGKTINKCSSPRAFSSVAGLSLYPSQRSINLLRWCHHSDNSYRASYHLYRFLKSVSV